LVRINNTRVKQIQASVSGPDLPHSTFGKFQEPSASNWRLSRYFHKNLDFR